MLLGQTLPRLILVCQPLPGQVVRRGRLVQGSGRAGRGRRWRVGKLQEQAGRIYARSAVGAFRDPCEGAQGAGSVGASEVGQVLPRRATHRGRLERSDLLHGAAERQGIGRGPVIEGVHLRGILLPNDPGNKGNDRGKRSRVGVLPTRARPRCLKNRQLSKTLV